MALTELFRVVTLRKYLSVVIYHRRYAGTMVETDDISNSATVDTGNLKTSDLFADLIRWRVSFNTYLGTCPLIWTILGCESIHAVRMPCGSGSCDGENANVENMNVGFLSDECRIPFVPCASGTACGGVAEYFFRTAPWSELCSFRKASAAENGRGLHSRQICCCCCYVGLLSTATKVS